MLLKDKAEIKLAATIIITMQAAITGIIAIIKIQVQT